MYIMYDVNNNYTYTYATDKDTCPSLATRHINIATQDTETGHTQTTQTPRHQAGGHREQQAADRRASYLYSDSGGAEGLNVMVMRPTIQYESKRAHDALSRTIRSSPPARRPKRHPPANNSPTQNPAAGPVYLCLHVYTTQA